MASIQHIFHIDAPFEKVFEAISTIKGIQSWWTNDCFGNEEVGGTICVRFAHAGGMDFEVIAAKPNQEYHWKTTDGHDDWIGTEIVLKLSSNDNKVRVDFNHTGWKEANNFMAQCNFSWGRYMISLRNYCEKGKGDPFISPEKK